jgi:hypothetical protein
MIDNARNHEREVFTSFDYFTYTSKHHLKARRWWFTINAFVGIELIKRKGAK